MLLEYKMTELTDDVLMSTDEKIILNAQKEYNNIRNFADWITELGNR